MQRPPAFEYGIHYFADAGVDGMHRRGRRFHHAGMAHHVRVGKVENHDVVFSALNALDGFVGNFERAHLRLEVVGCDLGGRYQRAVFAGVRRFHAAVKKNVTCAYFSVSAIRNCVLTLAARYAPSVLSSDSGL